MIHTKNSTSAWSKLLWCGIVSGPLFITTILIQGMVRADYNPIRHPGSSLAIGELGWIQTLNFIITGLLLVLFAVAIWKALRVSRPSTWGPLSIALVGLGLLGAGLFVTDPVSGYPLGTPDIIAQPSHSGQLHDSFSIGVFIGLPLACFVFARFFAKQKEWGWMAYSLVSGITVIATFVLASVAFQQTAGFVEFGGLFQRICLAVGLGWVSLLAWKFSR